MQKDVLPEFLTSIRHLNFVVSRRYRRRALFKAIGWFGDFRTFRRVLDFLSRRTK